MSYTIASIHLSALLGAIHSKFGTNGLNTKD